MEHDESIEERTRDWLAQENARLEALREELGRAGRIMKQEAEQLRAEKQLFERERENMQTELEETAQHLQKERQKLREEQAFFDKKFKVLELGFARLDADRKTFEAHKRAFEYRQKYERQDFFAEEPHLQDMVSQMYFFRGVTHILALKKRYKELIKIYHPDNLDGDKSALQQINREYEQLKKALSYQRKA